MAIWTVPGRTETTPPRSCSLYGMFLGKSVAWSLELNSSHIFDGGFSSDFSQHHAKKPWFQPPCFTENFRKIQI